MADEARGRTVSDAALKALAARHGWALRDEADPWATQDAIEALAPSDREAFARAWAPWRAAYDPAATEASLLAAAAQAEDSIDDALLDREELTPAVQAEILSHGNETRGRVRLSPWRRLAERDDDVPAVLEAIAQDGAPPERFAVSCNPNASEKALRRLVVSEDHAHVEPTTAANVAERSQDLSTIHAASLHADSALLAALRNPAYARRAPVALRSAPDAVVAALVPNGPLPQDLQDEIVLRRPDHLPGLLSSASPRTLSLAESLSEDSDLRATAAARLDRLAEGSADSKGAVAAERSARAQEARIRDLRVCAAFKPDAAALDRLDSRLDLAQDPFAPPALLEEISRYEMTDGMGGERTSVVEQIVLHPSLGGETVARLRREGLYDACERLDEILDTRWAQLPPRGKGEHDAYLAVSVLAEGRSFGGEDAPWRAVAPAGAAVPPGAATHRDWAIRYACVSRDGALSAADQAAIASRPNEELPILSALAARPDLDPGVAASLARALLSRERHRAENPPESADSRMEPDLTETAVGLSHLAANPAVPESVKALVLGCLDQGVRNVVARNTTSPQLQRRLLNDQAPGIRGALCTNRALAPDVAAHLVLDPDGNQVRTVLASAVALDQKVLCEGLKALARSVKGARPEVDVSSPGWHGATLFRCFLALGSRPNLIGPRVLDRMALHPHKDLRAMAAHVVKTRMQAGGSSRHEGLDRLHHQEALRERLARRERSRILAPANRLPPPAKPVVLDPSLRANPKGRAYVRQGPSRTRSQDVR